MAYFQEIKKDAVLIQHQLICLKNNKARFSVKKPATLGDGIYKFPLDQQDHYRNYFDQHGSQINAIKFIPASGLASRMFYFLRDFLLKFDPNHDNFETYLADESNPEFRYFVQHIEQFTFYNLIKIQIEKKGLSLTNDALFIHHFIQILLDDVELGMEGKAKALLPLLATQKVQMSLLLNFKLSRHFNFFLIHLKQKFTLQLMPINFPLLLHWRIN